MREEDIRPDQLIRENKRLYIEDVNRLLKRENEFVEVSCPACGSYNWKNKFMKDGFNFVTCIKCETLFINPRPTADMLYEYYATAKSIKHWNSCIFPASENARRRQIFMPRASKISELVKKYNVKTDVLMDVGAGFGTFCEVIKKLSIFNRVIALEPSPSLAETCRKRGLEVIQRPIEEACINEEINVMTSFELIEHLYSPKDFLLSCASMLSKNGLLIITTPNIKGFDLLTLGKLSDNIAGPNHLNYFHPRSISQLLHNCGFKVIDLSTPGKLDAEIVRKKILNREFDISNQPFLKQILIDEWEKLGNVFQNFLADNLLSSSMWVVARKVNGVG